MKMILRITILILMLVIASRNCIAEMLIADVSKEEAKQMGVTMRSAKSGDAGVKVWLEFKTNGKLRTFKRVELEIGEGKNRIMSAPLLPVQPVPECVVVNFSANPAYLAKSTLMIVVQGDNALGGEGYRLKVNDFIQLEKPQ